MPHPFAYFRDPMPTWTLLIGIGLGMICIYLTTQKLVLQRSGTATYAKLVSFERAQNGLRKHLSPVEIEFVDLLGARHREKLSDLQIDLWGLGELIPIRYDAADPSHCEVDHRWSRWFVPILLGVISVFFILLSIASLFASPQLIGAALLGMFSLLCLFAGLSGVYRTSVADKILRQVVSQTEEYFYHESTRLNGDGTSSAIPERQYFARVHFTDENGQRKRVVIECPESLTEKPVGTDFEIRYDPRALDTAEMTAPASVGYFQSGLIIFLGLLTMSFAVLLKNRA